MTALSVDTNLLDILPRLAHIKPLLTVPLG